MELYHVPAEIDEAVRAFASEKLDRALDTCDRATRQEGQDAVERRRWSTLPRSIPEKKGR